MESNWGEIMPELAVRHCAHILQYRKSAALRAVHSCHLLVWCEHAALWADAWQTDSSWPLGCSQMLEKVRTSSWLSKQICCSFSPRHKHTLTNPPAVFSHNPVLPKVKCLTQGDIGSISCLLWLILQQFRAFKFTILPLTASYFS